MQSRAACRRITLRRLALGESTASVVFTPKQDAGVIFDPIRAC